MAINFGNDNIKVIYVGSDEIKEVYYGSELVWEGINGYWVHKDTGVKTSFGLEDPSITNGIMSAPSWGPDCSEVKIPYGVVELGDNCFNNCSSLTSIEIPEGVTSLGSGCFWSCSSLILINIPEGVTSLGFSCFRECSSLPSIIFPESITSIGNYCFYNCSSLTLATVLPAIPPSLGGTSVFSRAYSINIKVRSAYVNTYKTATRWSSHADKISVLESSLDGYWVHKDTGVKTYFGLDNPDGIMDAPPWGPDCSEVILPEGVTSLGGRCFENCSSLTSITLPEGITSLELYCFRGCTSLTSITLPESVTSLADGCFNDCTSLTLATVLPATPPSTGWTLFVNVHASFNIKVRAPYVDAYKAATRWANFADKISAI